MGRAMNKEHARMIALAFMRYAEMEAKNAERARKMVESWRKDGAGETIRLRRPKPFQQPDGGNMDRKFSMTRICMESDRHDPSMPPAALGTLHPTDIFQTAEGLFMLLRHERSAEKEEPRSSVMLLFPAQVIIKMPSNVEVHERRARITVLED